MKKLVLFLALIFIVSFNSIGQTIIVHNGIAVVEIKTPFRPNWDDTTKAKYIGVRINSDNLHNRASLSWSLYSHNMKPLNSFGSIDVDSMSYKLWDGNSVFPFNYVSTNLNIIIK